jgi:hypothetical protein
VVGAVVEDGRCGLAGGDVEQVDRDRVAVGRRRGDPRPVGRPGREADADAGPGICDDRAAVRIHRRQPAVGADRCKAGVGAGSRRGGRVRDDAAADDREEDERGHEHQRDRDERAARTARLEFDLLGLDGCGLGLVGFAETRPAGLRPAELGPGAEVGLRRRIGRAALVHH